MYYMTSFKANLSQIGAGPPDLERLISLLAEPRGHTIISWGQSGSQELRISGSLSSRLAVRISGSQDHCPHGQADAVDADIYRNFSRVMLLIKNSRLKIVD